MTKEQSTGWGKKLTALLVVCVFSSDFVFAASVVAPVLLARYSAPQRENIQKSASVLGLSFAADGKLVLAEKDAGTGEFAAQPLDEKTAGKVVKFLSKLPADDPELGMALAMQSYLAPRMDPRQLDDNAFLKRGQDQRLELTALGRTALLDILTASDGGLLEPPAKEIQKKSEVVVCGQGAYSCDAPKSRAAGGVMAVRRSDAAMGDPNGAFDGSRLELGDFDWNNMDNAVSAAGGLKGFAQTAERKGYSYNKEAGTVRVLVAADHAAAQDHFKVSDSEAVKGEVYRQTGLDQALLDQHGAQVVRVVGNIVAIDVPLPSAAKLGLALQKQGVESRPARVYKAAKTGAEAALKSPASALMGAQFLPIPSALLGKKEANTVKPKLAEGGTIVDSAGLHKEGMTGKSAYVGIIDSGIDMKHQDFMDDKGQSRVREYIDFTEEGKDDVVGHGTHVAGIVGGTGAASNGKFKGMAPDARFKVAKVFGTKGETDESVILAAMKWMRDGQKVDLINMSLGGPGVANKDPLSSLANQMMVKDNILIVAAAGNEGPFEGSVGSPGNSRYALTVGGVDKDGKPVFFSSRGPIRDASGKLLYAKPDLVGVAGGVDFSAVEKQTLMVQARPADDLRDAPAGLKSAGKGGPAGKGCVYGPGVAAPRSSADPDTACTVAGYPGYRLMSGTSQAAPMTAGFAADVIGYAKENGAEVDAFEIKAMLMETAKDLGEKKEFQGAGLINGTRAAQTVIDRVKRGIPIGNIAYALAMRLTSSDQTKLKDQNRYEMTPVGLLDKQTGHILNTEAELMKALEEIRETQPLMMVSRKEDLISV